VVGRRVGFDAGQPGLSSAGGTGRPIQGRLVRELMKRGLSVEGINSSTAGMKSSQFGVEAKSAGRAKR